MTRPKTERDLLLASRVREVAQRVGGPTRLAEKTSIPLRTLNEYLAGRKIPPKRLNAIADVGEVTVGWLLTGEEPKERTGHAAVAAAARRLREATLEAALERAEELGAQVIRRGGSVTISAGVGMSNKGWKTAEGGLSMPEPHANFDPRAVELLDRSVLVEMLTKYLELLDRLRLNWTPEQRAKRFLLVYERCMRAGRVDESSIQEAIDMLA